MTSASVRLPAGALAADAAGLAVGLAAGLGAGLAVGLAVGLAAAPLAGARFAEAEFVAVGEAAREVGGFTVFAPGR